MTCFDNEQLATQLTAVYFLQSTFLESTSKQQPNIHGRQITSRYHNYMAVSAHLLAMDALIDILLNWWSLLLTDVVIYIVYVFFPNI